MALTDQERSRYKCAFAPFLTQLGADDAVSENCRILTAHIRSTETLNSSAYDAAASIQCVFVTNRFSADISQTL